MADDNHGGMPPKYSTKRADNLRINRLLRQSTGIRLYDQLPEYEIGSNKLWIFINGKKEMVDLDYVEKTSTSIVFQKEIPKGAVVEFLFFS
jgi:hypothetical protein